jgi:hypothetical protein
MGVYVTGSEARLNVIEEFLKRDKKYLLDSLPKGTIIDPAADWVVVLKNGDSMSDDARYVWLQRTINEFVNVLRPQLQRWYAEIQD